MLLSVDEPNEVNITKAAEFTHSTGFHYCLKHSGRALESKFSRTPDRTRDNNLRHAAFQSHDHGAGVQLRFVTLDQVTLERRDGFAGGLDLSDQRQVDLS